MERVIKYCVSCDEGFAERFSFCPNCAGELQLFQMAPVSPATEEQPTRESQVRILNSAPPNLVENTPVNEDAEERDPEFVKVPFVTAPTASKQSTPESAFDQEESPKEYGGIGRLGYFLSMAGLSIVINQMISGSASLAGKPSRVFIWVAIVISVLLVFFRLKNIGTSGWWVLLWFVPFANLWLGYRCLAQQEGYVETKELDGPGQLVRFAYILLGILIVIVLLYAFFYRPEPPGYLRRS